MTNRSNMIPIAGRLHSVAEGNIGMGANEIYDDTREVTQDTLNGAILEEKTYALTDYSGMGRVVLKKNIVEGVNTLTQDMFYKGEIGSRVPNTNTIFVIQYDYVLGENITVPANCVLEFNGGSISGASTLNGNNAGVLGYRLDSVLCPTTNLALEVTVNSIVEIADVSYLHEGLVITVTKGFYGISKDVLKYRVDNSVSKGMNIGGTKVVPVFDADIANPKYYGAYGKFADNSQNRTINTYLTPTKANTLFNFEALTFHYDGTDPAHCTIESGDEIDWIGIQAALFNIDANRVYIPTGNYYINKELKCPAHTSIQGTNRWETIINVIPNNINAFNFTWDRCQISDLSIYSTNLVNNTIGVANNTGSCGILTEGRHHCNINNVEIYGFSYGVKFGSSSWNCRIDNCECWYCDKGIAIWTEGNNITVTRCHCNYNNVGIEIGGNYAMGVPIIGCCLESNYVGIQLLAAFYGCIEGCYFENNGATTLYDSRGDIYIPSVDSDLLGVTAFIFSCYFYVGTTIDAYHHNIIIEGDNQYHNVEISNCKFRASTSRTQPTYALRTFGATITFNNNSLFNTSEFRGIDPFRIKNFAIIGKEVPAGTGLYKIWEGMQNEITIRGRITDATSKITKIEVVISKEPNIIGVYYGNDPSLKVFYKTSGSITTLFVQSNCGVPMGRIIDQNNELELVSSSEEISSLTELTLNKITTT